MPSSPQFLFVTCQVGAEATVKGELARCWPEFRFAYSRPGFLTFKLPQDHALADDFDLQSIFARAFAFSLGKAQGATLDELATGAWNIVGDIHAKRLHVWPRDQRAAGDRGYEPGLNEASAQALDALCRAAPTSQAAALAAEASQATPGELVIDCVLVGESEWWLGVHRASSGPSCLPGGFDELALPPKAVSRAWLKMHEALDWSALPLTPGDLCVEIGCAPGGSCQALLERGVKVLGVDPALVDPAVLAHPNFVHFRKRGADVRRREFRQAKWLMADMNVAPEYTLDTVEAIVTHPDVRVRGVLLTLKLLQWTLAADAPSWLERVRSWGFDRVVARQLQHGRQEICVAAERVSHKRYRSTPHSDSIHRVR